MALIFTDSFNRASTSSSLGTAETGQPWQILNGSWRINSNRAEAIGSGNQNAVIDSGESDGSLKAKLKGNGGNSAWLTFRASNAQNYFFAEVRSDQNSINLYRRQNDQNTPLGTAPISYVEGGEVKATFTGSSIEIFYNGASKLKAVDAFNQTATRHGIGSWYTGSWHDDVSFETSTAGGGNPPAGSYRGVAHVEDYGAAGDGQKDDTSAFLSAVSYLNSVGGGLLQLSRGDYRLASLTAPIPLDNIIVRGIGMNTSRILIPSLGDNVPAFLLSSAATGYGTGMEDLYLVGPGPRQIGVITTTTVGVEATKKCFFNRVKIANFKYGININGASHVQIVGCRLEANYYNLYMQRDEGDHTILDSEFTGAAMAGIAINGDKEGHSGTWILRCHTGYCPYGIYQPAPANPGASQGFFNGWTIDNLRFEAIGNGAIYTERWNATDSGTVKDSIIRNVGFSWSDWQDHAILSRPRDYAVVLGSVFGRMVYEPGDAPFYKRAGGLGVFRLNGNGAVWRGEFDYSDFTVGGDGRSYLMPRSPRPVTVTGSTGGNVVLTMIAEDGFATSNPSRPYRKIILELTGYVNSTGTAQTIAFPAPLAKPPIVLHNTANIPGLTLGNSQITINPNNGTAYSGTIILYGY
jgi:hypothetical protein